MTTTIEHADEAELKRKLIVILESMDCVVTESKALRLEKYHDVRQRYGLPPSVMSMRLQRFRDRGGDFPKETGPSGRILKLHITPQLHELLGKPAKKSLIP
jgi:hypothetical protein